MSLPVFDIDLEDSRVDPVLKLDHVMWVLAEASGLVRPGRDQYVGNWNQLLEDVADMVWAYRDLKER